jgi:hypothetical protein
MLSTIEKAITKRVIETALKAGYLVGAEAGELADIKPTDNLEKILDSAFSYDVVSLILQAPDYDEEEDLREWIELDFFESQKDIINNYSVGLTSFMKNMSFKGLVIDL